MADTSQNDALKNEKDSFAERICKSKWKKMTNNEECESSHIHSHAHTRILMS